MKVAGVIVAGGRSRRMGQEKALLEFSGEPLIARIAARLAPQVEALAINANGDPARFEFLSLPVIADTAATGSPLAGLLAALEWSAAGGVDAVATAPSDTPFLPRDLVARLAGKTAAIAASAQRHYVCGFWPATLLPELRGRIAEGSLIRMQDWAALAGARIVTWQPTPCDPFFNLNTPADLVEARRVAAAFPNA